MKMTTASSKRREREEEEIVKNKERRRKRHDCDVYTGKTLFYIRIRTKDAAK